MIAATRTIFGEQKNSTSEGCRAKKGTVETITNNTLATKLSFCVRELRGRKARTAYMVPHISLAQGDCFYGLNRKGCNVKTKSIRKEEKDIKKVYLLASRKICLGLFTPENFSDSLERAMMVGKLLSLLIELEPLKINMNATEKADDLITKLLKDLPLQEKVHLAAFLIGFSRPMSLSEIEDYVKDVI